MERETTDFPLQDITLDQSLQPRAALDAETVEDYTARYAEGADMPAVTLFREGGVHRLVDGFHRVAAAKEAGRETIPAEVRWGTFRDALLFAAGANIGHGLRRTNADKRRAVEMLLGDAECAGWSDSEIARHCRVNHHLVAEMRSRHLGELQDGSKSTLATRTVTRGGKTYAMNISRIGKRIASGAGSKKQETASPDNDYIPEANDHGLYACPFCGAANVDLLQIPEGWRAQCVTPDCGVPGPCGPDIMAAQDAWNRRDGPGKYEMTAPDYR